MCETWSAAPDVVLPLSWVEYDVISAPATKERTNGLPIGCVLYFYKLNLNSIQVKTIEETNLWIFAQVQHFNVKFTIGTIYIRPGYDLRVALELLQIALKEAHEGYLTEAVVLAVDFNARVGTYNQLEEEIMETRT